MDGTKRKANGLSVPPRDPIDLGSTPPWALPPVYHEESALRFTQSPEFKLTIDPAALQAGSAAVPRSLPAWTPLNLSPAAHVPSRPQISRKQTGKRDLPVASRTTKDEEVDDYNDDEDDIICGVDTVNGHDSVYLLNADQGSWSGPLDSEDDPQVRATLPDQAVLALQHLKRAQQLVEQQQQKQRSLDPAGYEATEAEYSGSEGDTVVGEASEELQGEAEQIFATQDDYEEEKKKWHKDLLLRNVIRMIKSKLNRGALLTLERLGPVNLTMTCAHPDCPAPNGLIPPGAYYVILGQPRQLEKAERLCLFCLEWLWNGKGMCRPLPGPDVPTQTIAAKLTVTSLNLDGAMDDDRLLAAGLELNSVTTGAPTSWLSSMRHSPDSLTPATEYSSASSLALQGTDPVRKRALDSETPSPLPREAAPYFAVSREARGLMQGFGEAFLDGQWRVVKKRGDAANKAEDVNARRSARLQPAVRAKTTSAEADNHVAGPLSTAKTPAVFEGRGHWSDTITEEIGRADKRLEEMYKQRSQALISLGPGQSAIVRHPKCPRSAAKHTVSVDRFGVRYTDLLAEPATKYWTQEAENTSKRARTDHQSTKVGPVADELYHSHLAKAWFRSQEEHWCICHGPDDGSEMILCANEKCLVGWYHVTCVGVDAEADAHNDQPDSASSDSAEMDRPAWVCHICMIYSQAGTRTTMPCSMTVEHVKRMFAPSYAFRKAKGGEAQNTHLSATMLLPHGAVSKQQRGPLRLPQLDGPSESPKRPGLSQKHNTTPGGPYTPGSITSDGKWRHPQTRFQHLAAYIRAGNSLDERERAAVELWKEASTEQLGWEKHLERAENARLVCADSADEGVGEGVEGANGEVKGGDELEEGEIVETGDGFTVGRDIAEYAEQNGDQDGGLSEAKAGLSKSDCRGKDLTAVLAEARARRTA
ncbi:hypothetical protein LTR85_003897 [Meristemomyces frigidus]|nr:hypothetical protein LTR85_003897 [Meristemomyces frigidus]